MLDNGHLLQGSIIQATRNGIVIKRAVSGMVQYRHDEIRDIIFESPKGTITGKYVGWADGVYALEVKDRVVRVQDGEIVGTGSRLMPTAKRAVSDTPLTIHETEADQADPISEKGTGGPIEPIKPIMITGSVEPAREGEPKLVCNLRLSRDSDEKIILIYAAIADTALPELDFVAKSGVISIEPGKTEARVEIPLVNDKTAEDDERFQIYLTVDPALADLATRSIIATILDDD